MMENVKRGDEGETARRPVRQSVSQPARPGDRPGAGFTRSGPGPATSPWGIGRGQLVL